LFFSIFKNSKFNIKIYIFYGTGSYPFPPQGLQDKNLLKARYVPLNGPYFFIASIPYCEHVGVYLQEERVNGEIAD